ELLGTGHHVAGRVHDERAAVEHQIVLTAHLVAVDQGRARLRRPPRGQLQPHVVLLPLVGRGVGRDDQVHPGSAERGDRAAVLPQVFADHHADVDTVEPQDGQLVARLEPAVFVEDTVVRQVVLELPGDHLTTPQRRYRVAWPALVVQISDDGE